VWTMDPAGALDLDDAVSVRALPDGAVRVGVHIADVSHFVEPGTRLGAQAAARATSVYLATGETLPMLPHRLSQDLCRCAPPPPARFACSSCAAAPRGAATDTAATDTAEPPYDHERAVCVCWPPPTGPQRLYVGRRRPAHSVAGLPGTGPLAPCPLQCRARTVPNPTSPRFCRDGACPHQRVRISISAPGHVLAPHPPHARHRALTRP
jgi:hypothetical protein